MSEPPSNPFLNPRLLLETSVPQQRVAWLWYGTAAFALVVMLSTIVRTHVAHGDQLVQAFSAIAMLGLIAAMIFLTGMAARTVQREQTQLEAIEELVQLRRWPEAAATLEELLSRPTRTPQARFQGLVYLAAVLARYHRFADAIFVYDYLLSLPGVEGEAAYGLKLGRTMSLLREDRLFDADRAIIELRRLGGRQDSAGLALIEIYRDVKTGHPAEAVELFDKSLPMMRKQLGMRIADIHALAARAYDLLSREAEARAHWELATLLTPPAELVRRYPEVDATARKYPARPTPPEVA